MNWYKKIQMKKNAKEYEMAPNLLEENKLDNPEEEQEEKWRSFSYSTTPSEVIKERTEKIAPSGYYMLVRYPREWAVIAKAVNQGIDSYLEGFTRSKFDNKTGNVNIHPAEMSILLRRLLEDGSDEAMDLRQDILTTLNIEEI